MAPHASSDRSHETPAANGTSTTASTHNSSNGTDVVPVIVVGAGPVGLLVALRLAMNQIHAIVLEKESSLSQLPRAIGYHGPVHEVFHEIGLYDQISTEGMPSGGYVWRKLPTDVVDANGTVIGKELGEIIGDNAMSKAGPDGKFERGRYSIQLAQCRLAEIFMENAVKTGFVKVFWEHEVTGLSQDENEVAVTVKTAREGTKVIKGQYLAACDGGKSTVRKLLGIRLSGHSWPERFVATDVLRTAPVVPELSVHFTVDETYWGIVTPLEHVEAGKQGLWRYSMAVPARPNDDPNSVPLTDEQVLEPEYVDSLLLRQIDGPRPSDHIVVRKSLYKMHQLLASTMHRGRCFLAGDSAHINNPIGGLGLCTGLLDGDALAQTLQIAFSTSSSDPNLEHLFNRYSAERRWVFQNVIHPFSSANKTRLHGAKPEDMAREDWYFRALARGDPKELEAIHRPLSAQWRTDMRKFWPGATPGKETKTTNEVAA
ncbi:FAD/NAD(P)-binding domain-containing protein [Daldinia sp. FL1419]|nr:FAD/NAD(P)-binding domain-containing protein [Daldinia sp. FL1419]